MYGLDLEKNLLGKILYEADSSDIVKFILILPLFIIIIITDIYIAWSGVFVGPILLFLFRSLLCDGSIRIFYWLMRRQRTVFSIYGSFADRKY
jgi:hypothetical protein